MPNYWFFSFQVFLWVPLSFGETWSDCMHRIHTALQEHQAVVLIVCRMAFHLSGKVIALHLKK